ncbi:MAG: flagella synthesis protein FlgN [Sulfuriferula sp.]
MNALSTRLLEHVTEENQLMDGLLELIQQEQALLVTNSIKDMQHLIDSKAKYISHLANLAHQRHLTLASNGLQADEAGMQIWLEQNNAAIVNDSWQKLILKVQTAKEYNRTNGLLINTQLNRNQSTLNVLRGSNNTGSFYGPNGHTTRTTLPRSLLVG